MPRSSQDEAPIAVDIPELEGRYVDLGGYTVGYERFKVVGSGLSAPITDAPCHAV